MTKRKYIKTCSIYSSSSKNIEKKGNRIKKVELNLPPDSATFVSAILKDQRFHLQQLIRASNQKKYISVQNRVTKIQNQWPDLAKRLNLDPLDFENLVDDEDRKKRLNTDFRNFVRDNFVRRNYWYEHYTKPAIFTRTTRKNINYTCTSAVCLGTDNAAAHEPSTLPRTSLATSSPLSQHVDITPLDFSNTISSPGTRLPHGLFPKRTLGVTVDQNQNCGEEAPRIEIKSASDDNERLSKKVAKRADLESRNRVMMTEHQLPLPIGWELRMSRNHNREYYYSTTTGESQWTHPSNKQEV